MASHYFTHEDQVSIEDFKAFCAQRLNPEEYPLAREVTANVLIYERTALDAIADTDKKTVLNELHRALSYGPGVFVVRGLYDDVKVLDRASLIFEEIMRAEAKSKIQADHFSRAGNNGRIWNALQKLAEAAPETFIDYYANPTLDLICQAWLGPAWRMTSQVNQVRPGGEAQQPHRDYHLGFQQSAFAAEFPIPVQILSQYLTLQGAVAHTDMPLLSGPTRLLPWSHQYELGYIAYRHPAFADYFSKHYVQLPLKKGDGLFFNPALFHAAGANTTVDHVRTANLLQISSAFGIPMEEVNHEQILKLLYPHLKNSTLTPERLNTAINVAARGYSFPTNLDTDPPLGGMVPQTQQALVREAIQQGWRAELFNQKLDEHSARKKA
ncbi:phytanoyl-CoA dioxygenase family protein [Serratia nematodiphila]|uniref:phytanoyl-CoA dioxygenase family protein n=1 Tax=Serratia marcescens TaxID=615 RepID=UPI00148C5C0B|nr:phytanoyl-CoA dioxygenase family protein [Serratia marcescens]MBM1296805.1 phytanoyl-CoA dioxygenase family protein [Serratia nematodiphila]QJU40333.1 phytanoyl-CoA dioxygenase [Serratia marcescens]BEM58184.1 phytanoyl-CoA dioxygenase [Serratia marcescens]BEO42629.1 phytanoyl-CoA dioxygenase [Serratia marcescens]